jgi:hypothetical protein
MSLPSPLATNGQCGGLEVRIILAARPKCGLLNQSHTDQGVASANRERCRAAEKREEQDFLIRRRPRIYGTRVPFRIAQNHHRTVSKY